MKTILKIKETWDAAPNHGDRNKNILVAEALGWTGIKWLPSHPNYLCTKPDGNNEYLPDFTTDATAVLQALDDVGIKKYNICCDSEYSVAINDWPYKADKEDDIKKREMHRIYFELFNIGHPTLELACGFAVYAFNELKQKKGKNDGKE